jgi:hypothetical protein
MQFVQKEIETPRWLKQRVGEVIIAKPRFFGHLTWNVGTDGDRTVKFDVDVHGTLGEFNLHVILEKNVENWHMSKCWLGDEQCDLDP